VTASLSALRAKPAPKISSAEFFLAFGPTFTFLVLAGMVATATPTIIATLTQIFALR